jgi:hypothetical protein
MFMNAFFYRKERKGKSKVREDIFAISPSRHFAISILMCFSIVSYVPIVVKKYTVEPRRKELHEVRRGGHEGYSKNHEEKKS